MKTLTNIEKIAYLLLLIVFGIGIYFANIDADYFDASFAQEDGLVEYGTAVMLFCISIFLFLKLLKVATKKNLSWKTGVFLMAIIFLFGAGEEISWGQRIFNIQSSEYFLENNAQQETNLHNMVVNGKKVNKIVFSQLLTIVLVIYLIILPILYRKNNWIKNLTDSFAVPIPRIQHTIGFLIATALILAMPASRKWELYELAFGVIFFLIFLNPFNKFIYQK